MTWTKEKLRMRMQEEIEKDISLGKVRAYLKSLLQPLETIKSDIQRNTRLPQGFLV